MLTDDRGKISAFAKGARRSGSKFVAATNLFCFGDFGLYGARNSYSINEAKITNYFSFLREDFKGAYYGMYFAEIADYYCHENLNDKEMLTLMYQSLRALESEKFDNRLIKACFEIKAVSIEGEFPGLRDNAKYDKDTIYTVDYILRTPSVGLYSFSVKDNILKELITIGNDIVRYSIDQPLKSAQILETL